MNKIFFLVVAQVKKYGSKRILFWFLLFGMTLFFHLHNNYNQDEGVVLNGAWSLLNGEVLYKDFFEFIPPGAFYLVFWVWKLLGAGFFTADLLAVILVFLSAVGLYKTTSLFRDDSTKYTVAVFFTAYSSWWPIINHNVFSLTFLVWSCYFFLRGLRGGLNKEYFLSGLFVAFSILVLHQKGVALLFAEIGFFFFLFVFYGFRSLRMMMYYVAGLFPLLAFFLWSIKDIYYYLIKYPMFGYVSVNRIPYNLLIFSFVSLFVAIVVLYLKKNKDKGLWFLVFAQFFLLLSCYPLPDLYHVSLAIFPLIVIIFYLVGALKTPDSKVKYAIFISLLIVSIVGYWDVERHGKTSVYKVIGEYVEQNCPGKYLYAGPFSPSVYFDSKKMNATPFSVLITKQSSEGQFLSALDGLKKNAPSCAVLGYPPFLRRFRHNANNVVEDYIRSEYVLVDEPMKGMFFVYKKP